MFNGIAIYTDAELVQCAQVVVNRTDYCRV